MHPILRAVGPSVHDRIVLPDAKMPQGLLARVTGAALPMAYGVHHCLALDMRHPHMELILRSLALLTDIAELPFVPKPHGAS